MNHFFEGRNSNHFLNYSGWEAPSHKMGSVCFCFYPFADFAPWTLIGLRPDDTFFVVSLFNGGLDCRHNFVFIRIRNTKPCQSPLHVHCCQGIKMWQNLYRADYSNRETVGDNQTDMPYESRYVIYQGVAKSRNAGKLKPEY